MGDSLSKKIKQASTSCSSSISSSSSPPLSTAPASMAASPNTTVTISPKGQHTSTFIFLHGLGDTGHGWASTLAEIRPSHMKIVCPTAPTMPVTLNSGFMMPAWFDLKSLDPEGPEDEAGLKKSRDFVDRLISDEVACGIPPERILLGGFSQGGALALFTGVASKTQIGGIVALSCWLPMNKSAASWIKNVDVPVLQCHGDCDPVVPFKWGQMTSALMKKTFRSHEFKTFQGLGHSSSAEELDTIQKFVETILK